MTGTFRCAANSHASIQAEGEMGRRNIFVFVVVFIVVIIDNSALNARLVLGCWCLREVKISWCCSMVQTSRRILAISSTRNSKSLAKLTKLKR